MRKPEMEFSFACEILMISWDCESEAVELCEHNGWKSSPIMALIRMA